MRLNTVPDSIWRDSQQFIAFGCGIGAMPIMPGTFATLATLPLYVILVQLPGWLYSLVTIGIFLSGIWLCQRCSQAIGVHDHSGIVIDEIAGYLLTMIAAPSGTVWMWGGVVLFRIMDIYKPWPIYMADRCIGGGFGIMFDDLLAALYAFLLLQAVAWLVC